MTFLKLLKQTSEYQDQAIQLEEEYGRLFYENGESKDPTLGGKASITVPAAGIKDEKGESGTIAIPKLDLSIIYMQQNNQAKDQEEGDEDDDEEDDEDDSDEGGNAQNKGKYEYGKKMNSA
eukprot:CAMPEP_0176390658 /NCGR_PEP_ID=MMETSP0126-20121128/39352_1 /TAXON_ID=141414 ORGANISM="Strombidinopsis acuminatum, Strain SPMC142" /NCGR_SAMPLE_ID=MMETSP0126 /ASSEMBLY_ACC=CAM_ASM_000229 /LENGTH=120 /DNA_ID=CAMNT_0017760203 /DNA_START=1156 /DNA_END=1518 /DNA_ORIENTATION=+